MEIKTIGIASDHAGFALKQFVKKYLEEKGYQYKDYGTYNEESCDYSDFGHASRATIVTSATRWQRASRLERYSPASLSAVQAKAST